MKLKVYTVHDQKIEAYMQPFMAVTKADAIRRISDVVNGDQKHDFAKHSSDFTLFEIGEYDDTEGKYQMWDVKQNLGNLVEFRQEQLPSMVPDLAEPIRQLTKGH